MSSLAGLIGEDRLGPVTSLEAWAVAGRVPEAIVTPAGPEEVAELLRWAAAGGVGVVPRGGGAFLAGRRPGGRFVLLSTARLAGIQRYEPADLTLTAGAGTSLAEVNATLGEHRQWCPFDPPGGASRTLGGILAAGDAGPLSAGYGSPRDHLLGATVVTGDGRILELGGRVVKNVAGFDLLRVLVGSRGTLGVLTSACLRVFPRPEAEQVLLRRAERVGSLVDVARRIATAPVVPAASVLRADERGAGLSVLLQGAPARVAAEREVVERHAGAPLELMHGATARVALDAGADLADRAPVALTLSVLPSRLGELLSATEARSQGRAALSADVMAGSVRVGLQVGPEDVREVVGALRSAAEALGGTLAVDGSRLPADLSRLASAPPPGVGELEARLRRALDPAGVLWPRGEGA